MSDVVRAYRLGEGDVFSIGKMTYRFAGGVLAWQVENGVDEFGFPKYRDSGKVYSVDEAQKIFEREMENEKMHKEPKLTEYQGLMMEKHVSEHTFYNNGKTTVAIVTLKNGFDVVGQSACVHREDFDLGLGRHYALVDALRQVDAFIGFGRQQEAYEQKQYVREQEEIERVMERLAKGEAEEAPDEAVEEVKKPAFVTGGLVNGELLHTIFNEPVVANGILSNGDDLTGEGLSFLKAKGVIELDNIGNAVEDEVEVEQEKYNISINLHDVTEIEIEQIANNMLEIINKKLSEKKFQGFVD